MTDNSTNFTDIIDGFLFLSFTNLSDMNKVYEQKLKDACQRREPGFAALRPNSVERKVRRKKTDQKFKTPPSSSLSKDPATNCDQNNTTGDEPQLQQPMPRSANFTVERMADDNSSQNHQISNGVSNDSLSNDENRCDNSSVLFSKTLDDVAKVGRIFQAICSLWDSILPKLMGQSLLNLEIIIQKRSENINEFGPRGCYKETIAAKDSNLEAAKHHRHNLNFEENRLEQQPIGEQEDCHDRNPSTSAAAAASNSYRNVASGQKMIVNHQMENEGASDENLHLENSINDYPGVNDDVTCKGDIANKAKFKREIVANNGFCDEINKRRKLDNNYKTGDCIINANNSNLSAPNISDKIVNTSVINFLTEDGKSDSLNKNDLQKRPVAVLPARTSSPSHPMGSLTNGRPNFLLANRNAEPQFSNDCSVRLLSPKKELLSGRTPPSSMSSSSFAQNFDSLQRRTPAGGAKIPSGGPGIRPPSINVETPKVNNVVQSTSSLAPLFLQQSIVPPPPSLQTFQPSTAAAVAAHFPTFLSPLAAAGFHGGSMLSFGNSMPRLPLIPIDTQVVANNHALFSHPVVPNIIPIKKKGKWCALHVQIAWDIHNKMKQKRDKMVNNSNCQSQQQQPSTSSSCSSIAENRHPSWSNSRDLPLIKNDIVNRKSCQPNPKIPVQNPNSGNGQRNAESNKGHHHHHHHHHHRENSSQQVNSTTKNKDREKNTNQEISRPKHSSPATNGHFDQKKLPLSSPLAADHSARSSSIVSANKTTPPDPQMNTNSHPAPPPPVPAPTNQTPINNPHQQEMSALNAALNNLRAAADMGNFLAAAGTFGQQRAMPQPQDYGQAAATFALFQSQLGAAANPHLMQASPMPFGSVDMMRLRPSFLTPSNASNVSSLGPAAISAPFDPHAAALANLYANLLQQRQYGVATATGLPPLPPGNNTYVPPLIPTAATSSTSSATTTQDLLSRLFMAYHQQPLQNGVASSGGFLDPATRQALAAQLFLNGFSVPSPLANGGAGVVRPSQLATLNQSPAASSSLSIQESPLFNPGNLFGGGGLNFFAANGGFESSQNSNNNAAAAKCLPSPFSATLQHMASQRNDFLMPGGQQQASINLPLSNNPSGHNLHNG